MGLINKAVKDPIHNLHSLSTIFVLSPVAQNSFVLKNPGFTGLNYCVIRHI